MIETLQVSTRERAQLVDIGAQVQKAVSGSGVAQGICHLFVPHTTAGIVINENYDPAVARDIEDVLAEIAPRGRSYQHTEGNADSHVKVGLAGSSATVPILDGKLALGTWQGIFFAEFDGPRSRRLILAVQPL